jgi:ABC-2 type transporter
MRGLKRIAESGRAVCATIHQPSVAIFSSFDSLLLLKRGGEVVYFGDLGEKSKHLIDYFESYDRTQKIRPGENPATWMLKTIGAGTAATEARPFDYASSYASSHLHAVALKRIHEICAGKSDSNKVSFASQFATLASTQGRAVLRRTQTVYFRTPSYNSVRILISVAVALIFSTVYIPFVPPTDESTMNSIMNSIYLSILFLNINAMNTVLALFEFERNMFYRHKAAEMYSARALVLGFTVSEFPYIFAAGTVFTMLFYWILGFRAEAGPFFWFWSFILVTLGCFTCLGQMLSACLRDSTTAQGFAGLISIGSSLFGGILLRPSQIPVFWM